MGQVIHVAAQEVADTYHCIMQRNPAQLNMKPLVGRKPYLVLVVFFMKQTMAKDIYSLMGIPQQISLALLLHVMLEQVSSTTGYH